MAPSIFPQNFRALLVFQIKTQEDCFNMTCNFVQRKIV